MLSSGGGGAFFLFLLSRALHAAARKQCGWDVQYMRPSVAWNQLVSPVPKHPWKAPGTRGGVNSN